MPTIEQEIHRLERRLAQLRAESSRINRAAETRAAIIVGATVNAPEVLALVRQLLASHARQQDLAAVRKAGWSWAEPVIR